MNAMLVFSAIVVVVVVVWSAFTQIRYNRMCKRDAALNAAYAAKREEMFEKEMGIISDPDYKSGLSEEDQKWAERNEDYHPRRR